MLLKDSTILCRTSFEEFKSSRKIHQLIFYIKKKIIVPKCVVNGMNLRLMLQSLSSLAPWKACQQINIENGDAYSKVMKVEAHLRILQLTAITH